MGAGSDERLIALVRELVEQELQRRGHRGALHSEGAWLVLGKGATQTRAEVQGTLEHWQELPDDLRERRARQIADLLSAQPASAPVAAHATHLARPTRPQKLSNRPGWSAIFAPLIVIGLTAFALFIAYRVLSPNGSSTWASLSGLLHPSPSAAPSAPRAAEPERAVPGASPCDQVRERIARGASIGPTDVEGWEVELVLLRDGAPSDLSQVPALKSFLSQRLGSSASTWIWPNAKALISAQRFDAQVEVLALPPLGAAQLSGVRFVFSGPYVAPYFSEELRADYLRLADALSDALAATDGALFAHCANADAHAIGSWFLGANPGRAVGAMVYFMADYSDLPILKPEVLGSGTLVERHSHAFDSINRATADLDRAHSATLLGRELGMISGRPKQPSRLTFPFRDANRAQRSSVQVARALGLASSG